MKRMVSGLAELEMKYRDVLKNIIENNDHELIKALCFSNFYDKAKGAFANFTHEYCELWMTCDDHSKNIDIALLPDTALCILRLTERVAGSEIANAAAKRVLETYAEEDKNEYEAEKFADCFSGVQLVDGALVRRTDSFCTNK